MRVHHRQPIVSTLSLRKMLVRRLPSVGSRYSLGYAPVMAEWEKYDAVGSLHKNGDRIYGFTTGYASDLAAAGTPTVSSLYRASITDEVRSVDVGDMLPVSSDGGFWWVTKGGATIGRLTWPAPDLPGHHAGVVEVQRVFVNDGVVVNLGGIFRPA